MHSLTHRSPLPVMRQDGEVPVGRVAAALRRDRRAAPESFTRLRVVEDRVGSVDGVLGFDVSAF